MQMKTIGFFRQIKPFQTNKNKAFLKNCIRCDQLLTTKKEKVINDFLKHNEGKDIPFEEKPLDIIRNIVIAIPFSILKSVLINLCRM